MTTIIAARFQLIEQVELALERLMQAGFAKGKMTSFYVNPAGQHATYPIGGDRYESPGITGFDKDTRVGSVIKATVETVIGADSSKDKHIDGHSNQVAHNANVTHTIRTDRSTQASEIVQIRKAGMLVAVELGVPNLEDKVVALLRGLGAKNIEELDGEIADGEWRDFDPLSEPSYLKD